MALCSAEKAPRHRVRVTSARCEHSKLHAPRLDDIADDLTIHAERLAGDASHVLYAFSIRAGERLLVEGRISVALGAAA